jgi:pimeloyl-ACP methyl ester carboxylesterase
MPRLQSNGIELEYESIGEGAPLVLIMGIGAQLIHWPDAFCHALADRGFRVIRFDNRDCGLSTRLEHLPVPNVRRAMVRGLLGMSLKAPYTLVDMADDVAGLLDALALEDAHILGASLGGMVAQTMAITHPSRVRTLTSLMSTTGNPRAAFAKPRALRALLQSPPRTKEEAVKNHLMFSRVCGSTKFELDHADTVHRAKLSFERGIYPRGVARQLAAVVATGDRTGALRFVRSPTLVIHGSVDPLIPPGGGRATARAIPGSELLMIDGMGHDLPPGTWPAVADAVERLARKRG